MRNFATTAHSARSRAGHREKAADGNARILVRFGGSTPPSRPKTGTAAEACACPATGNCRRGLLGAARDWRPCTQGLDQQHIPAFQNCKFQIVLKIDNVFHGSRAQRRQAMEVEAHGGGESRSSYRERVRFPRRRPYLIGSLLLCMVFLFKVFKIISVLNFNAQAARPQASIILVETIEINNCDIPGREPARARRPHGRNPG